MKVQLVVGWGAGLVALAVGIAGCGAATGEDNVSSSGEALSSPIDPVAFCRASGLNVIIGTQNNDVITAPRLQIASSHSEARTRSTLAPVTISSSPVRARTW